MAKRRRTLRRWWAALGLAGITALGALLQGIAGYSLGLPLWSQFSLLGLGALAAGCVELVTLVRERRDQVDGQGESEQVNTPRIVPRQLPANTPHFSGRDDQVKRLRELFGDLGAKPGKPRRPGVGKVAVISGPGGIGKTALAVFVGHQVSEHFPDGQLYVRLHDANGRAISLSTVVTRFIQDLDDKVQIPSTLEDRTNLYRSLLANKRILIMLDGVINASDALSLIPSNPESAVIITSRSQLGDIPAATREVLPKLTPHESMNLLNGIIGEERVKAEPEAAAEVAELCGHLPLALCLAGARLVAKPHWRILHLAERLRSEHRRLAELASGNISVQASLAISYKGLTDKVQRAFQRLAVLPGDSFSLWVVSAVLGLGYQAAEAVIERLVDASLVEVTDRPTSHGSRYRLHDLVKVYARELLAAGSEKFQRQSLDRVLNAYLSLVEHAAVLRDPDALAVIGRPPYVGEWSDPVRVSEATLQDPFQWFRDEHESILAVAREAYDIGNWELTYRLVRVLPAFFDHQAIMDDSALKSVIELALQATRRADSRRAEATILYVAGARQLNDGEYEDASSCLMRCVEMFESVGDPLGAARARTLLGEAELTRGRIDSAKVLLDAAIDQFSQRDSRAGFIGMLLRQRVTYPEIPFRPFPAKRGMISSKVPLRRFWSWVVGSELWGNFDDPVFHEWRLYPEVNDLGLNGSEGGDARDVRAGLRRWRRRYIGRLAIRYFGSRMAAPDGFASGMIIGSIITGCWWDYPGPYCSGPFIVYRLFGAKSWTLQAINVDLARSEVIRIIFPYLPGLGEFAKSSGRSYMGLPWEQRAQVVMKQVLARFDKGAYSKSEAAEEEVSLKAALVSERIFHVLWGTIFLGRFRRGDSDGYPSFSEVDPIRKALQVQSLWWVAFFDFCMGIMRRELGDKRSAVKAFESAVEGFNKVADRWHAECVQKELSSVLH